MNKENKEKEVRQEPHKEPPKRLIARCFGGLFIS